VKHVLLAEDDPSILLSLQFLLEDAGYTVTTATTGPDALARVQAHTPDLLVLDIMLPGMDGFEVCRRLREIPALAGMGIVMLTARGREHEMAHGLTIGADAYVTKPFGTRELMRVVRGLLERQ